MLPSRAGLACCHAAARYRADDAPELDQQPVAGRLDDAPLLRRNLRVDQLLAIDFLASNRACLVRLDQARVTDHVGRKIGRQPSINVIRCHVSASHPETGFGFTLWRVAMGVHGRGRAKSGQQTAVCI